MAGAYSAGASAGMTSIVTTGESKTERHNTPFASRHRHPPSRVPPRTIEPGRRNTRTAALRVSALVAMRDIRVLPERNWDLGCEYDRSAMTV
jgi:hypothetical protein